MPTGVEELDMSVEEFQELTGGEKMRVIDARVHLVFDSDEVDGETPERKMKEAIDMLNVVLVATNPNGISPQIFVDWSDLEIRRRIVGEQDVPVHQGTEADYISK